MSYDEHQAMWPQMIAALAAIDAALGLPEDGCNNLAQTLAAIRALKTPSTARKPLTEMQIQELCCAVDASGARPAATALIRAVEREHGIGA